MSGKELAVAEPWYTVEAVGDGITMLTEPHVARLWRANIFVISGRDRAVVVDTGMGVARLRPVVATLTDRPITLFTTHSHLDHIGAHPEFADCQILVHATEAGTLRAPTGPVGLDYASLSQAKRAEYRAAGFSTDGLMVDAVPAGVEISGHRFEGASATRLVEEGDVVDLGDRQFEVLHLPGHSPGSLGLWEAATAILIAGDAIYDGILIDTTDDADIPTYLRTMERLRTLPARVVHAGHKRAFGRARMIEIADGYIASRTGAAAAAPAELVSF